MAKSSSQVPFAPTAPTNNVFRNAQIKMMAGNNEPELPQTAMTEVVVNMTETDFTNKYLEA